MRINFKSISISMIMLSLVSCASIISGTKQNVTLNSNIQDAEVVLNGKVIGKTPFTGEIKKKTGTTLTIRKEGYMTQTVSLSTSLVPIFWGNIILGGTIGSATDFSSGAAYQYSPSTYFINLQKTDATKKDKKTSMYKEQIREFVLMNYAQLSKDIVRGEGEYLTSLNKKLNNNSREHNAFNSFVKKLVERNKDQLSVANALLESRYVTKNL